MSKPKCHWGGVDLGWLSPEHLRACTDAGCPGCRPCGKGHCALRGRCAAHVEHAAGIFTCPSCIGSVRADIAAVVELYASAMPVEAYAAGVESEAFNLIGPAASVDQFAARRQYDDAARGWCEFPPSNDPHHPYVVLGGWDMAMREVYGPYTDLFVSVTGAADYLTGLLEGAFPHTREFEEFAHDVARCRTHLEVVAHDSRAPEQGARCPRCADEREDGKGPRLRKRYAEGRDEPARAGERDTWHCPDVAAHWWTERDYRNRVEREFVKHAPALPVRELSDRCGVPASTIRRWAARTTRKIDDEWVEIPPKIKPVGRSDDGRKTYAVADVLRLADRQESQRA